MDPIPQVLTCQRMIQTEGVGALVRGLSPALLRAGTYGGMRLGLYSPCKSFFGADEQPSLGRKIAAGCMSGSIAAFFANPTDLVKVRMQMKTPSGHTHYTSAVDVVRRVVAKHGVVGLWKGSIPSMIRAATLTASQCATYDEVKQIIKRRLGVGDGFTTYIMASMVTGLVTTTATSPVDVVKVRSPPRLPAHPPVLSPPTRPYAYPPPPPHPHARRPCSRGARTPGGGSWG